MIYNAFQMCSCCHYIRPFIVITMPSHITIKNIAKRILLFSINLPFSRSLPLLSFLACSLAPDTHSHTHKIFFIFIFTFYSLFALHTIYFVDEMKNHKSRPRAYRVRFSTPKGTMMDIVCVCVCFGEEMALTYHISMRR